MTLPSIRFNLYVMDEDKAWKYIGIIVFLMILIIDIAILRGLK